MSSIAAGNTTKASSFPSVSRKAATPPAVSSPSASRRATPPAEPRSTMSRGTEVPAKSPSATKKNSSLLVKPGSGKYSLSLTVHCSKEFAVVFLLFVHL